MHLVRGDQHLIRGIPGGHVDRTHGEIIVGVDVQRDGHSVNLLGFLALEGREDGADDAQQRVTVDQGTDAGQGAGRGRPYANADGGAVRLDAVDHDLQVGNDVGGGAAKVVRPQVDKHVIHAAEIVLLHVIAEIKGGRVRVPKGVGKRGAAVVGVGRLMGVIVRAPSWAALPFVRGRAQGADQLHGHCVAGEQIVHQMLRQGLIVGEAVPDNQHLFG